MTQKQILPDHEYDEQWKKVVENLFPSFVAFFLPSLHDKVDFSVPPISMDKEFHRLLYGKEKAGAIRNDKLVKVKLQTGEDTSS